MLRRKKEQSNTVYWGEEVEEDAVYFVYLKKIRYVSLTGDVVNKDQLQWETVKFKRLKAASLTKLVESFFADSDENQNLVLVVIATYRTFSSSSDLFNELCNRTLQQLTFLISTNLDSKDWEQASILINILFCELKPYQCLGHFWAKSHKVESQTYTVKATVNFFNQVSFSVISTILQNAKLRSSERSKILEKWINVAQELRLIKNFSSLKAVISALQSASIFRLNKTWSCISKEKINLFKDLAEIYSEADNQSIHRDLIKKEGTSKIVDLNSRNGKYLNRKIIKYRRSQSEMGYVQGTIPYLGTFLTDLTMIDTLFPDFVQHNSKSFINLEKKKKEFDILVQIKMLQLSASNYRFQFYQQFWTWFNSIEPLTSDQSFAISCLLEPLPNSSTKSQKQNLKDVSIISYSKKISESADSGFNSSNKSSPTQKNPSNVSFDSSNNETSSKGSLSNLLQDCNSNNNCAQSNSYKFENSCIIKVSLDKSIDNSLNTNVYKSIWINNNDRTSCVLKKAMRKHGVSDDHTNFQLFQILPLQRGDFLIPEDANVFYAMKDGYPKFVIRYKWDCLTHQPIASCASISSSSAALPVDKNLNESSNNNNNHTGIAYLNKIIKLTATVNKLKSSSQQHMSRPLSTSPSSFYTPSISSCASTGKAIIKMSGNSCSGRHLDSLKMASFNSHKHKWKSSSLIDRLL